MNSKLITISEVAKKLGTRPDYVQGGGGNVSYKIDGTSMAVKASGFRLDAITPATGFVTVAFEPLRTFYNTQNTTADLNTLIIENDKEVTKNILGESGSLRPSIETGFHALLGSVVLHTHSVYANILTCSVEGKGLSAELFPESVWIEYYTPGIALTLAINHSNKTVTSQIFFLKNHGLIIVAETTQEAYILHESVNATIREYFKLLEPYPTFNLDVESNAIISDSKYLSNSILQTPDIIKSFPKTILFPDQVVYGSQISFDHTIPSAITINLDSGSIICTTKESEALAIIETITAWLYIFTTIKKLGLTPTYIPPEEGSFIANLDSEKYRKSIF